MFITQVAEESSNPCCKNITFFITFEEEGLFLPRNSLQNQIVNCYVNRPYINVNVAKYSTT